MKELLSQYARYNAWANQKIGEAILAQPEALFTAEVKSSFSSLRETLLHIWMAESVWWQRIKLQEVIIHPNENFTGSPQELINNLLQQSRQWEEWVLNASEASLTHEFIYRNLKSERFKNPVYQTLMHVFNHSTYHRGQLVTMLRTLGVTQIPALDFIQWCRKK